MLVCGSFRHFVDALSTERSIETSVMGTGTTRVFVDVATEQTDPRRPRTRRFSRGRDVHLPRTYDLRMVRYVFLLLRTQQASPSSLDSGAAIALSTSTVTNSF